MDARPCFSGARAALRCAVRWLLCRCVCVPHGRLHEIQRVRQFLAEHDGQFLHDLVLLLLLLGLAAGPVLAGVHAGKRRERRGGRHGVEEQERVDDQSIHSGGSAGARGGLRCAAAAENKRSETLRSVSPAALQAWRADLLHVPRHTS